METTSTNESRLDKSLTEGYEFKLGQYISTGFDIFKKEPWLFMGFLIISIIISMVVSSVIPNFVLSTLVSACVSVPLGVGIYIVSNKIRSNQNAQFGDFFGGFKNFTPLIINYLVTTFIMIVIFSPVIIYLVFSVGIISQLSGISGSNDIAGITALATMIFALPAVIILFFISMIFAVYFGVALVFSQMLIVFNGMDFWTAIRTSMKLVNKKWFSFLGFFIVIGLINILGVLCLIIGVLVTAPASACAIYAAYEDIAGGESSAVDSDLTSNILDA